MDRILKVAWREFVETVRTKLFIVTVLLTPALIGVLIFAQTKITKRMTVGALPDRRVAVACADVELAGELRARFERHNQAKPQRRILLDLAEGGLPDLEKARARVAQGQVDGFLLASEGLVEGRGKAQYLSKTRNMADLDLPGIVHGFLSESATRVRCRRQGLSPEAVAALNRPVMVEQIEVGEKSAKPKDMGKAGAAILAPFALMFLMFIGIITSSQWLLTSVIEEKNSRVMEVLLSAVSPFELMAGKILGLAGVGMTLMAVWGGVGWAAALRFGVVETTLPAHLGYFLAYFALGYLLVASLMAAIGSGFNNLKETQGALTPIMMVFVLPMVFWPLLAQQPNGALATIASFIPPLTPMIMMLRLAASPKVPTAQIIGSILVLAASVPLAIWAAAKIFRVGVLMYGKPPSLRELLRWLRAD
ncbi:MAG: ABC transporter permease [Planctomycetes bacterium]|nr:ABC transporter permease [Planctomycetota bacterium]MBM4084912.1 ABC transporter permease [Planctomycetota bacterium]